MQKASVPISKSQRLRKNCGHKKAPKTGLSGAPCWIRTSGLTLRSYDERLQRRIMASHLLLKTPYVMGILEIELHTQSHAIP